MPQQNKRGDAGHSAGVPARPHKPVPSDKTASTKSVTHTRSSEHTSPNVSQRQKTQQVVRNGQAGGKTRTNLPQQRRSMTASEQQTPTKRRTSTNALSNTSAKMGRGANRATVTQSRRNQKRAQKQREEARKAAAAQRAQAKKQAEKEQRKKKKAK